MKKELKNTNAAKATKPFPVALRFYEDGVWRDGTPEEHAAEAAGQIFIGGAIEGVNPNQKSKPTPDTKSPKAQRK